VTLQTATMTQGLINSMFGGDLNEILSRCVFGCGQYGTNGLLEGGDVGFKEDLGRVVCTEVWRECLGTARGRKNKARKEVERGGAVLESKSGDLAEGERRLEGFAKVLERVVTGDGGGDIATVDTLETLLADLDDKMDENDDAVTAALESARRRRIELEVEISNVKKAEEDGVCPTCGRGTENHSPVAHVGELKTSLSAVCGTVSGLERNQRDAKSVKRNERSAVARRLEDARRREGEVARAERDVEVWKEQVEKGAAVVVTLTAELAEKTAQLEEATQLEVIFGSKGIQGYVLEDLVSELQVSRGRQSDCESEARTLAQTLQVGVNEENVALNAHSSAALRSHRRPLYSLMSVALGVPQSAPNITHCGNPPSSLTLAAGH